MRKYKYVIYSSLFFIFSAGLIATPFVAPVIVTQTVLVMWGVFLTLSAVAQTIDEIRMLKNLIRPREIDYVKRTVESFEYKSEARKWIEEGFADGSITAEEYEKYAPTEEEAIKSMMEIKEEQVKEADELIEKWRKEQLIKQLAGI